MGFNSGFKGLKFTYFYSVFVTVTSTLVVSSRESLNKLAKKKKKSPITSVQLSLTMSHEQKIKRVLASLFFIDNSYLLKIVNVLTVIQKLP